MLNFEKEVIKMALKDVWDFIQNLTSSEFVPFKELAGEAVFANVASGLNYPEALLALRQELQSLGLSLSGEDTVDDVDSYTQMAVNAITYRIFTLRGA